MSPVAYIGFGANLGDRRATFDAALKALHELPGTEVTAASRLYETIPVAISDHGPEFLNAVVALETELSARDLIAHMRVIELHLGKSPGHRSDLSRAIDLDLLLFGEQLVHDGSIEVPHPRMHERAFVLVPLAEVAPHAIHPILGRTVATMCGLLPREAVQGVRCLETLTEVGDPEGSRYPEAS